MAIPVGKSVEFVCVFFVCVSVKFLPITPLLSGLFVRRAFCAYFGAFSGGSRERVGFAKVLRLILSENLTWNRHVEKIITKGNKWMFFIIQLKRAGIPVDDIVTFYCTCFRPVLEYCFPVFHHGLPNTCLTISRECRSGL